VVTRRTFLAAPATLLAACSHRRGAGFDGYAFVANEEGQAIAAVDLSTFTVARRIPVDGKPSCVVASPSHPAVFALTPANGTIYEIPCAGLRVRRKLTLARTALEMRVSADGRALWVACTEPKQLVRVSLSEFQVTATIPLPHAPADFDLSQDGSSAVAGFGSAGSFALVHLEGRGQPSVVPVGQTLSAVRFRSDSRQILAASPEDRTISIIDALTGRLVVRLPLAMKPQNLCFKSDGGQLFVTGEGMDAVAIVYPYTTEVAETVLAGRGPAAMAALTTPDFDFLFVANPPSGDVTIVDVETRKAIAGVSVGEEPGFITTTPDGQYALVLNRKSGDMAVIRAGAIRARRDRSAPLFTMIPVGSRPVSAAAVRSS
jgi:YVTN family beta-propeller protein